MEERLVRIDLVPQRPAVQIGFEERLFDFAGLGRIPFVDAPGFLLCSTARAPTRSIGSLQKRTIHGLINPDNAGAQLIDHIQGNRESSAVDMSARNHPCIGFQVDESFGAGA